MSVNHFKSLLFKSAHLQSEIDREHQRRWPNWLRLLKLKKLRLAIKDRIQKLVDKRIDVVLRSSRVKFKSVKNRQFQNV